MESLCKHVIVWRNRVGRWRGHAESRLAGCLFDELKRTVFIGCSLKSKIM